MYLLLLWACTADTHGVAEGEPPGADVAGGKADEAPGLEAFVGRYRLTERPDDDWSPVRTHARSGEWLDVRLDDQELVVALHYELSAGDDRWWAPIAGPVGGDPEIEVYTVNDQGWFGDSALVRKRIVTTREWVDDQTIEERTEMYEWPVSVRVWEDWQHYGTIVHRIRLTDGGLEYTAYESQYDESEHRLLYQRHR